MELTCDIYTEKRGTYYMRSISTEYRVHYYSIHNLQCRSVRYVSRNTPLCHSTLSYSVAYYSTLLWLQYLEYYSTVG